MQASAQVLESYSRLKVVLGNDQALELIKYLEVHSDDQREEIRREMLTKGDFSELKSETKASIDELRVDIKELKASTKSDFEELKASTKSEIEGLRVTTKSDFEELKASTKSEIEGLRVSTKADIDDLRVTTKDSIAGLRVDIEKSKSEMLKWMFIFWVGQAATTVAIILAVFKH